MSTNSVAFSTFTVYNQHLCLVPEHFRHHKRRPASSLAVIPILFPQSLTTTNLLLVAMDLIDLGISHKWNSVTCPFVSGSFHSASCLQDFSTREQVSLLHFFFFFFLVLPVYCYQPISLHPRAHMLSHVIPWTSARQTPLSMDFSRQEYWSGLPFPSPASFLFYG